MLLAERQRLQITPKALHGIEAIIAAIRPIDDIEGQMVGHVREHFASSTDCCNRPAASARWPAPR